MVKTDLPIVWSCPKCRHRLYILANSMFHGERTICRINQRELTKIDRVGDFPNWCPLKDYKERE